MKHLAAGFCIVQLVLAYLPANATGAVVHSDPDWLHKPTPAELMAVWPRAALRKRIGGQAAITCTVTIAGRAENCRVKSETPPEEGFGAAAVMLAAQFLFRPATDDGKPVSSKVIIPVTFAEMGPLYGDLRDVLVLNRGFWLAAPTRQDVAAVYPRGPATRAEPGRTTMRCTLTRSGGLKNCRVGATEPADKGFEDAALRLASKFKSVPTMLDGRSVADALVDVPLSFDPELLKPGGADANPSVSHPDWTKAPSKAEALSLFPAQARAAGVKHGSAVVACTVALDGALTACATLSESPPGLGFGEAARTFASQSAMSVWSREGRSVVGARVSVPVRLDQPEPSGSASAANR